MNRIWEPSIGWAWHLCIKRVCQRFHMHITAATMFAFLASEEVNDMFLKFLTRALHRGRYEVVLAIITARKPNITSGHLESIWSKLSLRRLMRLSWAAFQDLRRTLAIYTKKVYWCCTRWLIITVLSCIAYWLQCAVCGNRRRVFLTT